MLILPVIIVSLLTAFVVICGARLFQMGSGLAELIRKYGGVLVAILGLFSALVLFLPSLLEFVDSKSVLVNTLLALLCYSVLGAVIASVRKLLMHPKKQKGHKGERVSSSALACVSAIDIVRNAAVGLIFGIMLVADFGAGIVGLCVVALWEIIRIAKDNNEFETTVVPSLTVNVNNFGRAILLAIGVIAGYCLMTGQMQLSSSISLLSFAYLLFLVACQLVAFAKLIKK